MDDEAQQRYNRLQKTSWIAYYLGRGAREVGGQAILGETLLCAAFQFSTKRFRQFSLHFPVYVRGVGPADGTSAIGL